MANGANIRPTLSCSAGKRTPKLIFYTLYCVSKMTQPVKVWNLGPDWVTLGGPHWKAWRAGFGPWAGGCPTPYIEYSSSRNLKATCVEKSKLKTIYNLPKGILSFVLNRTLSTLLVKNCDCGCGNGYPTVVLSGIKTFLEQDIWNLHQGSMLHVIDQMASDLTST